MHFPLSVEADAAISDSLMSMGAVLSTSLLCGNVQACEFSIRITLQIALFLLLNMIPTNFSWHRNILKTI